MSFQYLNNYRGIAILLVILAHALTAFSGADGAAGASFAVKALDVIVKDCTVIFIALAGYFFTALLPAYHYPAFLKNKFENVIVPYLIVSLPAALLYIGGIKQTHYWIDMNWFHTLNPLYQYVFLMVTGAQLGPLWFVPAIVLFYLFSPVLFFLARRNLVPVFFLLSLVPALYVGRPQFNENPLQSFVFFLPAYTMGMLLAQYKIAYEKIAPASLPLLALTLAGIVAAYDILKYNASIDLLAKLALTYVLMAVCFRYLNVKIVFLDLMARLSFYLFFIHGYFVGAFRSILPKLGFSVDGIIAILTASVLTILLSIAAYIIIKLIFGRKTKMLVGA
jgi:peptidoglycan/LPS O-acetylase OafA/YrhL